MGLVRLDKLLASQGTASRSDVKKLIYKGQVTVNDVVVKSPNAKVNTDSDVVKLNGEVVGAEEFVYYMMNKPAGVICATQDKHEKTVIDIVPAKYKRKGLFPVGRLDKDTEGLLLITNDGDFAHRVTSPNKEVYKTYYALIDSPISNDDIEA
ncbi:MAG: pseudouridine synthase, partial [Ruminococcus sp.]|nr:pseudouridine synthase [Ruminococcus sp.]